MARSIFQGVHLPWFIYDLKNNILITTDTIPGDIADNRRIGISEVQIPGQDYDPVTTTGNGNEKVSFTIPIIARNGTVGNSGLISALKNLRSNKSITSIFLTAVGISIDKNPKVLYYYGVGYPGEYFVAKCDFVHKAGWVNAFGQAEYTECQIELIKDHTSILNGAEEQYRRIAAYAGIAQGAYSVAQDIIARLRQ